MNHHSMLNTLRDKSTVSTRLCNQDRHAQLEDMTRAVVDQADLVRDRMQKADDLWTEFHDPFEVLQTKLMQITKTLRDLPEINIWNPNTMKKRLCQFKEISDSLKQDKYKLHNINNVAKRMLNLVNCSTLKKEFDEFNEDWVEAKGFVSKEENRCIILSASRLLFSSRFTLIISAKCSKFYYEKVTTEYSLASRLSLAIEIYRCIEFCNIGFHSAVFI